MTQVQDVYIVGAARTAVGSFGGSLKDVPPAELGKLVAVAAMERAKVSPQDVEHVVMGQVIPTGPTDAYLARVVSINAGIPDHAAALTLNRACGSGLQAIVSAAQMLALGEAQITLAGGAESMSQAPHIVKAARFGQKTGRIEMLDALLETLADPFEHMAMGVTGENVAEMYAISRETQDAYSVESHRRAAAAIAEGRFKEQIVPVEIKTRKGTTVFDTDEHVRPDASLADMAKLKPVFKKEGGTVTAGNSSGINDGAAAVVLATAAAIEQRGLVPLAKIRGWGHAGVDPRFMGLGPVKAVPIALERAGLSLADMDVIEANEAFASQTCAVGDLLGFDPANLNPNGSGISLGHPVGATGAILIVKAIYELRRMGGRYALITLCIGGGQGIAMVIENMA